MNKPPVLSDMRILSMGRHGWWSEDLRDLAKAQRDADIEYYEPKIEQAKQKVAEDIGGLICCLAGNLMLEDKEAGMLLANQLQPLIDTIKLGYLPHLPRKEKDPDLEFNHEIHDGHGW